MSRKSRQDLAALVDQNVYDNTNKEILAAMVRDVLLDYRDSHFNWISDELKTAKYNSTQTLEQYLNTIAGSVPVYGTVLDIDVGNNSDPVNFTVDGIISSAKYLHRSSLKCQIEVNFNVNIGNKRLIPVATTDSTDWAAQGTILTPVIRRISTTQIRVSMREVTGETQSINLEIIAL